MLNYAQHPEEEKMSKRVKINTTAGIVLCWIAGTSTTVAVELHYSTPTHWWNPLGAVVLGWCGAVVMAFVLALVSE